MTITGFEMRATGEMLLTVCEALKIGLDRVCVFRVEQVDSDGDVMLAPPTDVVRVILTNDKGLPFWRGPTCRVSLDSILRDCETKKAERSQADIALADKALLRIDHGAAIRHERYLKNNFASYSRAWH